MSLKRYGIYTAYSPATDLRHEGLGRYLAAFLKGASEDSDIRFSVVCPSWSRSMLHDLFKAEGVPLASYEIVAPVGLPWLLRFLQKRQRKSKRPTGQQRLVKLIASLRLRAEEFAYGRLEQVVQAYSATTFLWALLPLLALMVLLAAIAVVALPLLWLVGLFAVMMGPSKRLMHKVAKPLTKPLKRLKRVLSNPKDSSWVVQLFQQMEQAEARRMQQLINDLHEIRAWYCPTAFWPAFNDIKAPRLMCVPDVVLSDFPIGFAQVTNERSLQTFRTLENAIEGGEHFVTYSEYVKWATLVDRYAVPAQNISVVHHAPNDLSRWVTVRGFEDAHTASINYSRSLLTSALQRSTNKNYISSFANPAIKFLFYASQVRPNKNIMTLLRAYEYLLHKRYMTHKLVLTGNPSAYSDIQRFIDEHNLQNDVLWLHGLKIQELAACYKLADLAVNPSLSEGGCPFTFTEALSVDTPVVMARIAVAEEVLTEPLLKDATFFDPYDWQDMAMRIECALTNREKLLSLQRQTYAELAKRTWTNVVREHLDILDRIATDEAQVSLA
jgi:glycosyltransferase involved in cell wall biosynthesis